MVKTAQDGIKCDSVVKEQQETIVQATKFQAAADSTIKAKDDVIAFQKERESKKDTLLTNQKALTGIAKKEKKKWVKIAITAIGVAVLEFVLFVAKD